MNTPSNTLAANEVRDFPHAMQLIREQCREEIIAHATAREIDTSPAAEYRNQSLGRLVEATQEAERIYSEHVGAAQRAAFEAIAANPDEDIAAIGQAALSGEWAGLAI
jgi:hypothetical protein